MHEVTRLPITAELLDQAAALLRLCDERGITVVTAESCTGGLVAGALTDIAGASSVVVGGFVTYSNEAKAASLGVDPGLILAHGAVSEPVARAMATGALSRSEAQLSVSITGIAGPGGGSAEKPVGLVHFATALGQDVRHRRMTFGDIGRTDVRREAVKTALAMLEEHALTVAAQPRP
jgi:nicotinamide-nucleotide amidase